MSKTTFEPSPASLEEKLATYWQLVDEREQMQARIARAKNEKDSVNERIFQKVMTDYEASLGDLTAQLDPLKEEIDTLRRQATQDIKQLDAAIAETEDEVSEAHFRHRVGEYDNARLSEIKSRLEPRLTEARGLRGELQSRLQAMDRRRPSGETETQETPPPPQAKTAPTPATPTAPSLEDPHRWAEELQPAAAADDADLDDPLAALTDPASSAGLHTTAKATPPAQGAPQATPGAGVRASTESQPSRARGATAAPAYPNLVIRSGVHSGKIVPLLPMTMSIGREHDNNIELKDPEVARYHARVVYEGGRFHVEDLDSSTGTWVNGQHHKKLALSEGDVIRIGATELVVEFA